MGAGQAPSGEARERAEDGGPVRTEQPASGGAQGARDAQAAAREAARAASEAAALAAAAQAAAARAAAEATARSQDAAAAQQPRPFNVLVPEPPKARRGLFLTLGLVAGFAAGALSGFGPWAEGFVRGHLHGDATHQLVPVSSFQDMARLPEDSGMVRSMREGGEKEAGGLGRAAEQLGVFAPVVAAYQQGGADGRTAALSGASFRSRVPMAPDTVLDRALDDDRWSRLVGGGKAGGPRPTLGRWEDQEPGPLGGAMRCAPVSLRERAVLAVCAWADDSVLGFYLDTGRRHRIDLGAVATDARAMRLAVEIPR
ncbi:hypothetical protein LO771_10090 [Streptacidiphilus sp. ASG 303]|uniref:hypothetical protein n=1 Tax=Streptacidiphilus sp. ASG 303 TaxID=2896847 RepID=UPI001E4627AC|nr:hypothetical protein [Streptacidiphilus sp. ASG 303]MCD0482741.1 hypothetical protein [Streptacidiphilus sp. ASG 303]